MAKFTLEINCDNADTVNFILGNLIKRSDDMLRNMNKRYVLFDSNGNVVGHAKYTEGE